MIIRVLTIILFSLSFVVPVFSQIIEERSEEEIEEVIQEGIIRQDEINQNVEKIWNETDRALEGLEDRLNKALEKQNIERAEQALKEKQSKQKIEENIKKIRDQNKKREEALARKAQHDAFLKEKYEKAQKIREDLERLQAEWEAKMDALKKAQAEKEYNKAMAVVPKNNAVLAERKEVANSAGNLSNELRESIRLDGIEGAVPANFGNNNKPVDNGSETPSLADMFSSLEQKNDTCSMITPDDDYENICKILEKELELSLMLEAMENEELNKNEDKKEITKSQEQEEQAKKTELERLFSIKFDNY